MSTFLTAEWRKLIMAQYTVAPETLTPWLPRGVELDLYRIGAEKRCYVSLIGFLFDRVRVKGVAIPFHTRFEEVNLRFYVVRTEADGTRKRGVVFIREFVPRTAITVIANALYEEPYATCPTSSAMFRTQQTLGVRYGWRYAGAWHSLAVEADHTPCPIAPGSEEEFITEHYWGYSRRRATARKPESTSAYPVEHPRWQTYPIRRYSIQADFGALYGPAFAALSTQSPDNILLAEGSAVGVHSGHRLPR